MGRVATPLSDRKIKLAKPKDKVYRLSDGNGLVLEIKPNGSKIWRVRYIFEKKAKMYTIGDYPTISLAEARYITTQVRNKILRGIDPVKERQEVELKKSIESKKKFETIAREFFDLKSKEWAKTYYSKQIRKAEIYIFPFIGFKNIDRITKSDIVDVVKNVKFIQTPSTKNTNKNETSRRVFNLIKQIYQFALHNDYTEIDIPNRIDINKIVPKTKIQNRIKAITDEKEIKNIYEIITHDFEGYHIIGNALKFLALTALRPGNVRNVQWKWIDMENRVITFPAEAMKSKKEFRLPLTDTLAEIIENMRDLTYHRSEYVFCSPVHIGRMMSENTLNVAHKRLGIINHNAHGWRSSFSTICYEHQKEHGMSAEVIEAQLHHQIGSSVTRAYMRSDFLEERRNLLEWWESFLEDEI
ncbi:tyrosine-type recombinase/integrase [Nitratiruptor tergarcus]|nr:integrase arm-type DNA-binding domain-containing protein [Nitratiruptor tergarcus]